MKTSRISDFREQVMNHYETGTSRGKDTGFKCLDGLTSFKQGYSTYFLGFAGAGKTELQMEMQFNLTERYGMRHSLLSGEIGNMEDVIGELVSKHLKKPFFKSNPFAPTEKEVYSALTHLDEYFFPINADEMELTIDGFYEHCLKIEKDLKVKIDTTSIDPWNDLDEDLSKYAGREDKYLSYALRKSRQMAKKHNWHNMIVTHARDMPPIALKSVTGSDVYCTAIPTLQSFAGGQVWGRRAFNVTAIWRPEHEAIDPSNGAPFKENEAIILQLKSKPKGVGKKGKCSLYFDWKKNRYYEMIDGNAYYAFEHEKHQTEFDSIPFDKPNNIIIKPSKMFNEIDNDETPF